MKKSYIIFGSCLLILGISALAVGCGSSATTATTTTTAASATTTSTAAGTTTTSTTTTTTTTSSGAQSQSDMEILADAMESASGNTGAGTGSSNQTLGNNVSGQSISALHTPSNSEGWTTTSYSYTTPNGITEEGTSSQRFLDANGDPVALTNLVTIEIDLGSNPPATMTYEVVFVAKKLQMHQHFSSSKQAGQFDMLQDLPTNFSSFPLTLSMTGEGFITILDPTPISTFEITSMAMSVSAYQNGTGEVSGYQAWQYSPQPPSSPEVLYYGTMTIFIDDLNAPPSTMTGEVYVDNTPNNDQQDGTLYGTISIDQNGNISIEAN